MEKILDENYYDFIIDNSLVSPSNEADVTYMNLRHSILHTLVDKTSMCDMGQHPYHRFPILYTLTSTLGLNNSNITQIQRNPALGLYGLGVLIAVIDTGVDYCHSAFRYHDGTSRIIS